MATYLPLELISIILSTLPSESLLRCRSVCKSCLSLISSPEFRLTHLHSFNQLNSRYIVRSCFSRKKQEVYALHLDDQHLTLDTPLVFPFNPHSNIFFNFIGYCNGVVCLYNKQSTTNNILLCSRYPKKKKKILLWNPSVRRKVTLIPPVFRVVRLGFGYCRMSDDYKVLSFDYYRSHVRERPKVKIYALKSTSWRSILFPDDLDYFFIRGPQLYINGSLHWLARDSGDSHYSILTFDMTTELFGEIRLPNYLNLFNYPRGDKLTVVKDSLGVIYDSGPNAMGFRTYKIWVMKEYKNPTSLTMIYDVHCPYTDLWRPLKLRDNGDLIIDSRRCNLMIYNKESGCYTVDGCVKDEKFWMIFIDKYQESLALLDVGSHTHLQK